MNKFILLILFCIFISPLAHSSTYDHQCFVSISIQQFNTETGVSIFSGGSTNKFDVTKAEHEDAYDIPIIAKDGSNMGVAKVDTGTLLGTPEGDLIQSHTYVEINGIQEYLGLIASTDSPMARSHRFFTSEVGKELKMVNVDLQCGIKK